MRNAVWLAAGVRRARDFEAKRSMSERGFKPRGHSKQHNQ